MKMIRITCLLLIAALLCGMNVSAEDSVAPESIKIVLSKTNMQIGETQKIKVSVSPANAGNYEMEYNSSNPQVVTAGIGTLIAVTEGTAEITVHVKDTEISDTVTVTVGNEQENIPVSDIVLNRSYLYLQKYEKEKIDYTILPENAANQGIIFTSLNTSVATVDEEGWVYGRKIGSTQIKVQSADKSIIKYVDIYVEDDGYDYDDSDDEISVRRVDIYDGEDEVTEIIEIMRTQTIQFTAQIYPDSATDKRIRWKSADNDIAEVDENGVVKGIAEGTTKIYAVARDNGKQDTITIKVTPYVRYPDSLSIAPEENAFWETGKTIKFIPSIAPEDTTERTIKWFVYGNCAIIDESGNVTITDKGKATVKAYTADWKLSYVYEFETSYCENHFVQFEEVFNVKQNRAIILTFDTDVNINSAILSIFAGTTSDGNGQTEEIDVEVVGNIIKINAQNGWNIGENYIYIKDSLRDIYGNPIGRNIKYKFTVRGMQRESN